MFILQCRQAKISYTGKFLVDVCFKYGDGPGGAVIREKFNFGQLPVMLKVSNVSSLIFILFWYKRLYVINHMDIYLPVMLNVNNVPSLFLVITHHFNNLFAVKTLSP